MSGSLRPLVFAVAGAVMIAAPLVHGLIRSQGSEESPAPVEAAVLTPAPEPQPSAPAAPDPPAQQQVGAPGSADLPLDLGLSFEREVLSPGEEQALLMVNLTARQGAVPGRDPIAVALLLDTSGSMAGRKLENARNAALQFVDSLDASDEVTLITFAREETVRLERYDLGRGAEPVRAEVGRIRAAGATCISCALERAYELLDRSDPSRPRWVIMISDGDTNQGITDASRLERLAERARADRLVTTSTIGLGRDYNESILAGIASGGTGDFFFVYNSSVISTVLDRELAQMTQVVASDVEVEFVAHGGASFDSSGLPRAVGGGERVTLTLGQVSTTDDRRLLLPLALPAGDLGQVATVRLSYRDRTGERRSLETTASLSRSADPAAVSASWDRSVSVEAARQSSARQVEQTLRECSETAGEGCLRGLDREAEQLEARAAEASSPELAVEAERLRGLSTQLRRPRASRSESRGAYLLGHARAREVQQGVVNPYHDHGMYDFSAME